MTTVTTTGAELVSPLGSGRATAEPSEMGKSEFLRLLVAQISHQDPMNPMDDKAFVAQMAQFSSLEQQIATNERLDALQLAQQNAAMSGALGLLDTTVTASGNRVALGETPSPEPLLLTLDAPSMNTRVEIFDSGGALVRTIELGALPGGEHRAIWDGLDDNGMPVGPGDYTFVPSAEDAGGSIQVTPLIRGRVESVAFNNGAAQLAVGPNTVALHQIQGIATTTVDD